MKPYIRTSKHSIGMKHYTYLESSIEMAITLIGYKFAVTIVLVFIYSARWITALVTVID